MDIEPYRVKKFLSDIAWQEIADHGGNVQTAISRVRDWLSDATQRLIRMPGGKTVAERYAIFRRELPAMCETYSLRVQELTFNDYVAQMEDWLTANPHVAI